MANTSLQVIERENKLVIDSRLIAEELGIQHKNFLASIEKYLEEIEDDWGQVAFETETVRNSVGAVNLTKFAYLTEPQAQLVMTYSKNTERVRQCKRKLIKAFDKAKNINSSQSMRIKELELQLAIATQQNQANQAALESKKVDNAMLTMHGAPVVLALRGMSNQVIEQEKRTTEVIDEKTGARFYGMTATQLKDLIAQKYGIKYKSGAEIIRYLESQDMGHLVAQTPRRVLSDYIPDEFVDEAVKVLTTGNRQMLLGEGE